jgi:hypothetical protein
LIFFSLSFPTWCPAEEAERMARMAFGVAAGLPRAEAAAPFGPEAGARGPGSSSAAARHIVDVAAGVGQGKGVGADVE